MWNSGNDDWISGNNISVVVDTAPYNIWSNWGAEKRDLYFLDINGNYYTQYNITPSEKVNDIKNTIYQMLSDYDSDGCTNDVDDASFTWDDDYDGDGTPDDCDSDDDNDGALDANDSDDNNQNICSDTDGDTCDDCSNGQYNTSDDGSDYDSDGVCDAGDSDYGNDLDLNNQSHPKNISLLNVYPNPFNPIINISFSQDIGNYMNMIIFDLNGETVKIFPNTYYSPGNYVLPWDASSLAAGIYIISFRSGIEIINKKIILAK